MSELQVPESAQVAVTTKVDEFPFRTELSLAPLIRYWEHEVAEGCSVLASVARTVLDQVARAPELAGPVTDLTAVRAHDDLLRALMVAVFSPAAEDEGYAAGESYLPDGMQRPQWYRPTDRGLEGKIREKLEHLRALDANARKKPD